MILPSSLEGRSGPEWLPDLFTGNASGKCDCGRSWSSHAFCIDCRKPCVLRGDFEESRAHFTHELLRMRQFDHKPVLEANALQALADVSGVQSYYKFGCEDSLIMFLYSQEPAAAAAGKKQNASKKIGKKNNKRGGRTPRRGGQPRGNSPERSLGPFIPCLKCPKILNTDRCTVSFCSVECKMKAVKDDPTVTLSNPRVYTRERIELLRAALYYAVAQASGEEYDISKWTYTWSSFSCCAVWTWEANKQPTPSLGVNQSEHLNWFSPQLSSTLFVVMAVSWFLWWWYLWNGCEVGTCGCRRFFVVYSLFWGWSAAESSLTKLFLVYYTCSSLCTNPSTEPWLCLPASVAACSLGPVYEHSLPGGCLQLQVMKCHVTLGLESMYLSLLFLCLAWVIRKCCIYPSHKLHASFFFLSLGSGVSWGWVICPNGSSNWVWTLCELVGIRGISSELELQNPGEPIYIMYSIFHLFRMLNDFCFLELVIIFWKLIYNFQIPSEHLFFL